LLMLSKAECCLQWESYETREYTMLNNWLLKQVVS
jgi:hypothetical protein